MIRILFMADNFFIYEKPERIVYQMQDQFEAGCCGGGLAGHSMCHAGQSEIFRFRIDAQRSQFAAPETGSINRVNAGVAAWSQR